MRLLAISALIATTFTLAACDNTPNADFEQSMKDRDAARAGDPYAALENSVPQTGWLSYTPKEQQKDWAEGRSGTFRASYDGLLSVLDTDKDVDRSLPVFKQCRAAYQRASDFQKMGEGDDAAAAKARDLALHDLKACRSEAQKLRKNDGKPGVTGAQLARFASAGVVIVGLKTVGQGAKDAGMKIWSEGQSYSSEDRPDFEFGIKSFRGY